MLNTIVQKLILAPNFVMNIIGFPTMAIWGNDCH